MKMEKRVRKYAKKAKKTVSGTRAPVKLPIFACQT